MPVSRKDVLGGAASDILGCNYSYRGAYPNFLAKYQGLINPNGTPTAGLVKGNQPSSHLTLVENYWQSCKRTKGDDHFAKLV